MPSDQEMTHEAHLCLEAVKVYGPTAHGVKVHDYVAPHLDQRSYGPSDTFLHLRLLAKQGLLDMVIDTDPDGNERTSWKLTNAGVDALSSKVG